MFAKARLAGVAGIAALLTGCATTTFVATWRNPDAAPLGKASGQTVVACVAVADPSLRCSAEDALVAELNRRGAKGVASYSILEPGRKDEAVAKAAFAKAGAAAAVVMRPLAVDRELSVTPAMYAGPNYSGLWSGYWGHGWGQPYTAPTVQTDTIVTVETLFYSLEQNKLVWSGRSKTVNPSKVPAFVREVVESAAAEMKKAGLLP